MRAAAGVVVVLLLAATAAAEASVSAPFAGDFRASAGIGVAGAHPGGLSSPRGAFDVPADATSVHLDADWGRDSPAARRLLLRACDGWCADDNVLGETAGVPPLALDLAIPASRNMTWEALVASGGTLESRVEGVATFQITEDPLAPPAPARGAGPTLSVVAALGAIAWLAWRILAARPAVASAALYHRVAKRDLLDHPARARLHEEIRRHPGIHFRALRDATGLAQGALDHHARLLSRAGLIVEHREQGARCFALPGALEPGILALFARVRSQTPRALLRDLDAAPATSVRELAARLGVPPSTIDDHLARLAEAGLVERVRDGSRLALRITARGRTLARVLA